MRILFLCNHWHVSRTPCRTVGLRPEFRTGRHQWVRAVAAGETPPDDLRFDAGKDTLMDLAARFPGGMPDLAIAWEPGYQALPLGLEEAPFPVVACYSDWNLSQTTQAGMLPLYERVFTDKRGVRTLQAMGYDRAEPFQMWGHDPEVSRVIPGIEKRWDIGMVGNLSADIQRDRAKWLARVAAMGERYQVRIAGGVYGEDYTRMINATKITFNRSIRGEMNMRCFEAAACGSLLFYEEENEEIRDVLEDGVHCVLYNADNLESLFDYYLTHDDERERIIAAARKRVTDLSLPRTLARLANRLEGLVQQPRTPKAAMSAPDLGKAQARQAAGSMSLGNEALAEKAIAGVLEATPNDADAWNDAAVLLSIRVGRSGDRARRRELTGQALAHMHRAVQLRPDSAFFLLNLAEMYAASETWDTALGLVQEALGVLPSCTDDPADPYCLPFPFEWSEYRVQLNTLYNATRETPGTFAPLRQRLLLHRGGMLLGRLAERVDNPELAEVGYRIAATARPDLGSARIALGRLLHARADWEGALVECEASLQSDPFQTEAWPRYAEILARYSTDAAAQFIRRALTILDSVAPPDEKLTLGALPELQQARESLLSLRDRVVLPA